MHQLDEIDAEFRSVDPHAWRRKGNREGRERLEPVLDNEHQVLAVTGVAAESDPERIKDGVAGRVTLRDFRQAVADETVQLDRHGTLDRGPCENVTRALQR